MDNLPPNLISHFNQPINHLPKTLETLLLSYSKFNQSVEDVLPPKLKKLHLGKRFRGTVERLPAGLEILHLERKFFGALDSLPVNLKELQLVSNLRVDNLPNTILSLELGGEFNSGYYLHSTG